MSNNFPGTVEIFVETRQVGVIKTKNDFKHFYNKIKSTGRIYYK